LINGDFISRSWLDVHKIFLSLLDRICGLRGAVSDHTAGPI